VSLLRVDAAIRSRFFGPSPDWSAAARIFFTAYIAANNSTSCLDIVSARAPQ
jgi:hypothetical protein